VDQEELATFWLPLMYYRLCDDPDNVEMSTIVKVGVFSLFSLGVGMMIAYPPLYFICVLPSPPCANYCVLFFWSYIHVYTAVCG